MDMLSYAAGKAAGAIVLTKIGLGTYQLVAKRFDSATGVETFPEILTLNHQQVSEAKMATDKAVSEAAIRSSGMRQLLDDIALLEV